MVTKTISNLIFIWILSVVIWNFNTAVAQEVRAAARVDSNNITIGDWLKLYVEVEHPSNVSVTWPQLTDLLEGLEIVQRG